MADLTREDQRTKAMAIIGVGIGFVFMASMVLGPIFEQWVGVNGIFLLTAVVSVLAIPVLLKVTPEPKRLREITDRQTIKAQITRVIKNPNLLQLDFGIFTLHAVLTSIFVVVPFALIELGGMDKTEHWKIYIPVMLLGVVGMLPFMKVSHQRKKIPATLRLAVLILCLSSAVVALSIESNWWGLLAGLVLFFVGFNTLEATLPSLITRIAPIANKGMATGVYNSAQFFGVFVGGAMSGWLSGMLGPQAVLWFCFCLLILWLLVTLFATPLALHESKLINFDKTDPGAAITLANKLKAVTGVLEISMVADEAKAYLKIDPDLIDAERVKVLTGQRIT